jgi:hypothetical protein
LESPSEKYHRSRAKREEILNELKRQSASHYEPINEKQQMIVKNGDDHKLLTVYVKEKRSTVNNKTQKLND